MTQAIHEIRVRQWLDHPGFDFRVAFKRKGDRLVVASLDGKFEWVLDALPERRRQQRPLPDRKFQCLWGNLVNAHGDTIRDSVRWENSYFPGTRSHGPVRPLLNQGRWSGGLKGRKNKARGK